LTTRSKFLRVESALSRVRGAFPASVLPQSNLEECSVLKLNSCSFHPIPIVIHCHPLSLIRTIQINNIENTLDKPPSLCHNPQARSAVCSAPFNRDQRPRSMVNRSTCPRFANARFLPHAQRPLGACRGLPRACPGLIHALPGVCPRPSQGLPGARPRPARGAQMPARFRPQSPVLDNHGR
jgi:hypothetical protein